MGSDEDWEIATNGLKAALEDMGMEYVVNEGDGAFYGPKIDFHLEDCLGRTWQCGTIQLDFQLPLRFDAEYVGADNERHRPIMIHRVVFGSIERFIGILTEHFAGNFPTWLTPVQAAVLPISEKYHGYAEKVIEKLKENGIRVQADFRAEKIGYKIREARLQRIPYLLVVGEKEAQSGEVTIKSRGEDLGSKKIEEFLEGIKKEIESKK